MAVRYITAPAKTVDVGGTAVAALYERSDKDRLQTLATEQRRIASLHRARTWAQQ